MGLSVVVPFYNGHQYLDRLLATIPDTIPVVLIDDVSEKPLPAPSNKNVTTFRLDKKGFFSGACNAGMDVTGDSDILILNQDVWFDDWKWLDELNRLRKEGYATIGDGVFGHPAWPNGYVQGTFMYMSRDAISNVGKFNVIDYPLWGATAEWQLRACRRGYKALPIEKLDWFNHRRDSDFGSSIKKVLGDHPEHKGWLIRTPPALSVIVPCYNYGRHLNDAISSLSGGETCLGKHPGQKFQSFEVVIVDDASQDETPEIGKALADDWKAIRYVRPDQNLGVAGAINYGIKNSLGRFITVLSADDMRSPESLEMMYRVAERNPNSVIYDNIEYFSKEKGLYKKLEMRDYDFDGILTKNIMHSGVMYTRDTWKFSGGYPENMKYGREDWAFNVACGIKGRCGIKVDNFGYWYRRNGEGQSFRNTAPGWRDFFLSQLKNTFYGIYNGERPVGCCGRGKTSTSNNRNGDTVKMQSNVRVGTGDLVKVEYIGRNWGTSSFFGPITKTRYTFGLKKKFGFVDRKDLKTGKRYEKGLLEFRSNGRPIFRVAQDQQLVPPQPKSYVEPKPIKVTEPTPVEVEKEPAPVTTEEPQLDAVAEEPQLVAVAPDADKEEIFNPANYTLPELESVVGDLPKEELEVALLMEKQDKQRVGAIRLFEEALSTFREEVLDG